MPIHQILALRVNMSQTIAMWSGPRNLSTAMMRSFGARSDTAVWDEPFFASFLSVTGKDHPGRAESLRAHETDPTLVAERCGQAAPNGRAYFFQKHMPHHMLAHTQDAFPLYWAEHGKHFFLIREPVRVIASYVKGRAEFDVDDLGYHAQRQLFDTLSDMTGRMPPIVDCMDILENPDGVLAALCTALDMPWDSAMLSWERGPRATDGAWAPYWYGSVENSTGFAAAPTHRPVVGAQYMDILAATQVDYEALYARRLTA